MEKHFFTKIKSNAIFISFILANATASFFQKKHNKQDQGSQVAPQGCKISPCNSMISIEPNFATFDEITLVESITYNLKQQKNGPGMAPI